VAALVIVGRPNTGKSTLFNRLVGGRVAITLKEPGITRDRIIREAIWCGQRFDVIDTGGLVPDADRDLEREIGRQVEVALSEAAVVVMVVDGTAGLLPLDEEIAAQLRHRGKSFLLAVNKCDVKRGYASGEFYSLGAERVLEISAEHGTGCDELMNEVIARLPNRAVDHSATRPLPCLAILGRPNVGKSTFLNSLLGVERAIVLPTPGTTRDALEERFEFEGRCFRLIDTAGIRRRSRVKESIEYYSVSRALAALYRCDVALVMIDVTEGPTAQDKRILSLAEKHGKGMVVVANKLDLVPSKLLKEVRQFVTSQLEFINYVPVIYTSALKGIGVKDVAYQADVVYDSGGRQLSAKLLRAVVLDRLQKVPPTVNVRVLGLSQVGTRPPVFRLRLSHLTAVSTAYQRYVVNQIRAQFGFPGYPIRLRITR